MEQIKILIADENPKTRKCCREALMRAGIRTVDEAGTYAASVLRGISASCAARHSLLVYKRSPNRIKHVYSQRQSCLGYYV